VRLWIRRPKQFRSVGLNARLHDELNASQAKVPGYDLAANQAAHIVHIGSGGIGSHVTSALVRKGVGRITLIDDDRVEHKNLTRQLFSKHDVGKLKSHVLAKQLARDALFPIELRSYPFRFQELLERGYNLSSPDLMICGVDNNPTRRAVSEYALQHHIPVIHAAVARDGNSLYVMVQEAPERACWGCAFPAHLNGNNYPCNLPGIIDVLQVVAGCIVYAADSLICTRHREWNVREIFLDGSVADRSRHVERRADCPLCARAVQTLPAAA